MKTAALHPILQVRAIAIAIRELIAGNEEADIGGPMRIVEEFKAAADPTYERALQMLLLFGVYAWLALSLLDLVRLWRLSRPADARASY